MSYEKSPPDNSNKKNNAKRINTLRAYNFLDKLAGFIFAKMENKKIRNRDSMADLDSEK
jgi:hypothetical protein